MPLPDSQDVHLIAWAADRRDVGYVRDELRSVVRLTLVD
ncbi:uncharacterized protein METZ01_LOCUS16108 [marine metagenome]|uniref:Uncharacterized protein n=1 Tax=marine metagenome TaxID=408172 RepID=A0A381P9H4_9ZZZZ